MSDDGRRFVADRGDDGVRLDRVVRRHLAAVRVSRTRVQRWIESGLVRVDGRAWHRVAARVPAGATVDLSALPLAERRRPEPEAIDVDVLYQDDDLLVVNKPPGQVVHPSYRHASGTLLNGILWRLARESPGDQPSLVNRLDKGTSGLLVVARRPGMHATLQRALASADARKDYIAIVRGAVEPATGALTMALAHDPRDRRRVVTAADGRFAETRYETLVAAPAIGLAVLRCRLVTGRLHQIRVHLSEAGWPIVGDRTYGSARDRAGAAARDDEVDAACARLTHQALHAWRLCVRHPTTGRLLEVEAPLPADVAALRTLVERRALRGAP